MDLLFFACFIIMVMVSFKGAFVFCLFYLDGYGVVQGSFCFCLFYLYSYGGVQWSFCFCLFYLYSYGVVQGSFCFLLVLSWWLWCRSMDLLFFACFTLIVMVSFKGAFVVFCFTLMVMVSFKGSFCLFYLDGYGVVQWIFCFLLVLPW